MVAIDSIVRIRDSSWSVVFKEGKAFCLTPEYKNKPFIVLATDCKLPTRREGYNKFSISDNDTVLFNAELGIVVFIDGSFCEPFIQDFNGCCPKCGGVVTLKFNP